jgi:Domain of unknown function (DUF1707)/Domain of unknown function (DUF4190)
MESNAPWAGGERGRIRAGDADREHVVDLLKGAYTEGRLSKDEYDDRVAKALSARTFADLDLLIADLPVARPMMVPPVADAAVLSPVAPTNNLAIASLAFGLGQFAIGPLATIPAIVLGHMARKQIKQTGERGAGLAVAGLMLGWGAVVLGIVIALFAVAVIQQMHQLPPPQFPQQFPQP